MQAAAPRLDAALWPLDDVHDHEMVVSIHRPPKWLVYFMENRIKMDDLEFGGYPYFRKPPYVGNCLAM